MSPFRALGLGLLALGLAFGGWVVVIVAWDMTRRPGRWMDRGYYR